MSRFYRLNLSDGSDTLYFTSDGTAAGLPCKIELPGADRLLSDVAVTNEDFNNDGAPVIQTAFFAKKGIELVATLQGSIKKTTFEDLNEMIQTALEAGEALILSGTGEPTDFQLNVIAFTPTVSGFSGDRIKGAVFRFLTT